MPSVRASRRTRCRVWLCAFLCATVAVLGCGIVGRERLDRVDDGSVFQTFGAERPGDWSGAVVELRHPARVRRVVVVPKATLTRLEVQVRTPQGAWKPIRSLRGRYASNLAVRTDAVADAVRVIVQMPSLRRDQGTHVAGTGTYIETILVYGTPIE
ncbi:hypothetical protein FJZ36_09120 [Candidatus Poribacteria bacterium]|nr:hypothetical protein [Candidatus Poribacteria bacterium]